MKRVFNIAALATLVAFASGCDSLPGKPAPGPDVPRPDSVLDAATLYKENCAGCHGENGRGAVATPIGLPEYQALVDEDTQLNIVAKGIPNTAMPGFSHKAGGFLTDQQIESLVRGLCARRGSGRSASAEQNSPTYADSTLGDSAAGASVYETSCSNCHGKAGGPTGVGLRTQHYIPCTRVCSRFAHRRDRRPPQPQHARLAHRKLVASAQRKRSPRRRRIPALAPKFDAGPALLHERNPPRATTGANP